MKQREEGGDRKKQKERGGDIKTQRGEAKLQKEEAA